MSLNISNSGKKQLRLHALQSKEAQERKLEEIHKPYLTTREAAAYLNRAVSTLQYWASTGEGLVQPVRIGKRLAFPTAEVKRVLGLPE
jgi:hypothetical protein